MPDQIINDEVPEYRQYQNAPSQNAIKEAEKKGFICGLLKAQEMVLTKGKNEIFTKHYFSKELATDILNLIVSLKGIDNA